MELYLCRHGIAVKVGEHGVTRDADRMLSEEGRARTLEAAHGLKALEVYPHRLLSSPYIRARETAELFRSVIAPNAQIEEMDKLAPGADVRAIAKWLRKNSGESIMLFGHMPDMAELASYLLTGTNILDLVFKKAAVCSITLGPLCSAGSGRLNWLLQPRQLRMLKA